MNPAYTQTRSGDIGCIDDRSRYLFMEYLLQAIIRFEGNVLVAVFGPIEMCIHVLYTCV